MRLMGADEIERLGDWRALVGALADGHRAPPALLDDLLLEHGGKAWLSRAAWAPDGDLGLKSVTVFPNNPQATPPRPSVNGAFLLFDGETGAVKAVLDGAALTVWKTVGDSLLGADLLARRDVGTLLVIGAGTIASRLPEGYLAIRPSIERVLIWNRTHARALALAATLRASLAADVEAADDLPSAVAAADVIASATMSVEPVLCGSWLKPGVHVDLIGAYRPDMREADDKVLRLGRLFVDRRETTLEDIGELKIPIEAGVIAETDVLGDLFDLVGGADGRDDDKDFTVFKNGGGAHLDLMTARFFINRAP